MVAPGNRYWHCPRIPASVRIFTLGAAPLAGISTETLVALTAATASMPGLQPELVGGLPAEKRHEPVRPGLDLHLRHHGVTDDTGHQPANRLRMECPTTVAHRSSLASSARSWASLASAAPSTACRPEAW